MLKSFLPLLLVLAVSFEVASCIRDTFEIAKLESVEHFTASSLQYPNRYGFEKRLVPSGPNDQQPPPSSEHPDTTDSFVEPTKDFVILHDVPAGQNPIHNP